MAYRGINIGLGGSVLVNPEGLAWVDEIGIFNRIAVGFED
jgi:hypothetical protein